MPRPIWKGFISFGLVMIPVNVYSAVSPSGDIDLDMLDPDDGARIRFLRVNERTGKEVPYKQIVKGYKLDSGDYVIVTPDDIKRAAEGITKGIEIVDFVPADEIDPVFFERPYYVAPGKGGEKVYALLCKTLVESGRVGIARAVLHSRQHLAALMPDEDGTRLKLIEMRFADELRDPGEVFEEAAAATKPTSREVSLAMALVEQMSGEWEPEKYRDDYIVKLRKFIEDKAQGVAPAKEKDDGARTPTKAPDIAELLERSVQGMKGAAGPRRAKSGARKHGRTTHKAKR